MGQGSSKELMARLSSVAEFSDEEVAAIFDHFDTDHNGILTTTELKRLNWQVSRGLGF